MKISRIPERKQLMVGDTIKLLPPDPSRSLATDLCWPDRDEVVVYELESKYMSNMSQVTGYSQAIKTTYTNWVYSYRLGI